MNNKEYQEWTLTTAVYPEAGSGSFRELLYLALGLGSEAGEFQGKVKKLVRGDNIDGDSMISELGDTYWYLTRLCTTLGITLDELAEINHDKLEQRKATNTIQGEGDNREKEAA